MKALVQTIVYICVLPVALVSSTAVYIFGHILAFCCDLLD